MCCKLFFYAGACGEASLLESAYIIMLSMGVGRNIAVLAYVSYVSINSFIISALGYRLVRIYMGVGINVIAIIWII